MWMSLKIWSVLLISYGVYGESRTYLQEMSDSHRYAVEEGFLKHVAGNFGFPPIRRSGGEKLL